MSDHLLRVYVWHQSARAALVARITGDDAGEGVISAAIAVLVMAFLGVLMWELFGDTLRRANTNVNSRLDQLR
jgi:hypothetical protein